MFSQYLTLPHPQKDNFMCSICGTDDDRSVVIYPVKKTQTGAWLKVEQAHEDCFQTIKKDD